MSTEEPPIEDRIKEIIIKQLGKGEKPVMELEDEFDVSIPDEDAEKIQTVGDAVKYIKEHTQKDGE